MKTTKRRLPNASFEISDKVRTVRGAGVIKHVFKAGPQGKPVYAVQFENKRIAEIFREDEVTLIERTNWEGGDAFSV